MVAINVEAWSGRHPRASNFCSIVFWLIAFLKSRVDAILIYYTVKQFNFTYVRGRAPCSQGKIPTASLCHTSTGNTPASAEKISGDTHLELDAETPPRRQGKATSSWANTAGTGNTPANAGKSPAHGSPEGLTQKHPRESEEKNGDAID
jgi:hypothetical protein